MTKIINLIGGPGTGKSTTAFALIYLMKINGLTVEYLPEVAKKHIWRKDFEKLNNQRDLVEETFISLNSFKSKIDYIITDGPIIMGLYYNRFFNPNKYDPHLDNYILECYNKFNNMNIFIHRNKSIKYETEGRIQTENEAGAIDRMMEKLLINNKIPFISFESQMLTANLEHSFVTNIFDLITKSL